MRAVFSIVRTGLTPLVALLGRFLTIAILTKTTIVRKAASASCVLDRFASVSGGLVAVENHKKKEQNP